MRTPSTPTRRTLGGFALALCATTLVACEEEPTYSGTCVGGCGRPGGPELFGPADPGDWTSFRNGSAREGVADGALLGDDVRVLWQRPAFLTLDYSAVKPSGAVWGDTLYYPSDDGSLFAFDRFTGEELWNTKLTNHFAGIHGTPYASKSAVWIGTYGGPVHALDPETGEEIYWFAHGTSIGSSPLYVPEHNALYVSHERGDFSDLPGAGYVSRNNPRTGEPLWVSERLDHFPHSSVAVDPETNRVFVGANDGIFRAYDADTGDLVWSRDFEPGDEYDPPTADIKTTPSISASRGLVIFGTWDSRVYALDMQTGDQVWAVNTGGRLMGSTAVHEATGRVYVGTMRRNNALLAIDLDTGDVVWRFDAGEGIQSSPAVNASGDGVVVGSSNGLVFGIDATTGQERWRFQADGDVTASPAWVGPHIYIAAFRGSLYALETFDN